MDAPGLREVTAALHTPADPRGVGVLLTHGAGGDLETAGLVALASVFAGAGADTLRVNLPYREQGRRLPPRAEYSVAPFASLLRAARSQITGVSRWIVGGRSYGGRVASLAVADGLVADGLVLYSYPLHPPGKPGRRRVDHWSRLHVPCLFLHGERDAFGSADAMRSELWRIGGAATFHEVEGADHSLRVSRAASPTGNASDEASVVGGLGGVVATWLDTHGL